MENKWNKWKKKKGQKKSFNPDREYLEKAQARFVAKGGCITKIDNDQIRASEGISRIFSDDTHQFLTSQF